jgi:hypothetical protein
MQHVRIAVAGTLTVVLLLVDVVAILVAAGEGGLTGVGLTGAGIGAVLSAAVAYGVADAVVHQWGSADGASRSAVMRICLIGMLWGCIRVGLGDAFVVPALFGLVWVFSQAWLFVEPADEADAPPDEAAAPADEAAAPADEDTEP